MQQDETEENYPGEGHEGSHDSEAIEHRFVILLGAGKTRARESLKSRKNFVKADRNTVHKGGNLSAEEKQQNANR